MEVAAGFRVLSSKGACYFSSCIGFDGLKADSAVQFVFIILLQARLSDMFRGTVVICIYFLKVMIIPLKVFYLVHWLQAQA